MYSSNSLPYPPSFFFTIRLYEVAKIGSTPEVTLATIAPLPVGATVVNVQFRIPLFFIFSLILSIKKVNHQNLVLLEYILNDHEILLSHKYS